MGMIYILYRKKLKLEYLNDLYKVIWLLYSRVWNEL